MIDGSTFHFIRPLWLLMLLPLAWLAFQALRSSQHSSTWQSVCDPHLLRHLLAEDIQQRQRWPVVALAIGWVIAVIALAGPAWSKLPQPVFRAQVAQIVALDLSTSMNAGDIKPSRLSRAKFKALDILKRNTDGQVGLIVFANEAFTVSPLTDDADTVTATVAALGTELMPSQGSRPDRALLLAGELFQQSGLHVGEVILISDGAADAAATHAAARQLRDQGIKVSVLSVGTPQGAPIPVPDSGFLKDASGQIVIPQVDHDELEKIASAGGGRFHVLTNDTQDLNVLLDRELQQQVFKEAEKALRTTDIWREEGPWLLLALLPLAALAFRRGWVGAIVLCVILPQQPTYAFEWNNLWQRADQQGANIIETDPKQAATFFENPMWRGTAHYRAGDYEQAAKSFADINTPDANYNLGNALARSGQLQEALAAYDRTLANQPDHQDALFNRQLVEQLLKEQEQQQSNPADSNENGESKNQQQSGGQNQQTENTQNAKGERSDDGGETSSDAQTQAGAPQGSGDKQSTQNTQQHSAEKQDADETDAAATNAMNEEDKGKQGQAEQNKHEAQARNQESNTSEPNANQQDAQDPDGQVAAGEQKTAQSETQQALEQWLRRIPDDPGGLLRRKFLRDHQRRDHRAETNPNPW